MHISLDQALGRESSSPSRVGDRLLQIAGGASAAYSLRSLTGNGGNAVRIRRSSDNVEVNVGFDGSGAVSTTSPITNVTEPTSLDLGTSWVVATGSASSTTLSPLSSLAVSGASSGFQVRVPINQPPIPSGNNVTVSTFVSSVTGSWSIFLADAGGTASSNIATMANSVSLTTTNANSAYIYIRSNDAAGAIQLAFGFGASYTVGDTTDTNLGDFISGTDAFVVTWYDQSGNGNDASQDTLNEQPKIADSSSGLLEGAEFDGTNDVIQATSVTEVTGPAISMFVVSERTVGGGGGATASLNKGTAGTVFMVTRDGSSNAQLAIRNTTNRTLNDSVSGNDRLTFVATTGNAAYKIGANGTSVTESTDTYGDDFESGDLDTVLIGARRPTSLYDFYTGLVKEVVIYNSDQTSNRTAVETNINNYYSIY